MVIVAEAERTRSINPGSEMPFADINAGTVKAFIQTHLTFCSPSVRAEEKKISSHISEFVQLLSLFIRFVFLLVEVFTGEHFKNILFSFHYYV